MTDPAPDTPDTPDAPNAPIETVEPTTPDERNLAVLTHLSTLLHLLLPFVAVLAPIIIWQSKRTESVFVADHAVETVNFQITLAVYGLAFLLLGFVTCGIGFAISGLVYLLGLVGMILAVLAANKGDYYRYPMTLRLVTDTFDDA